MGKLIIDDLPDDVLQTLERAAARTERKVADVAAEQLVKAVRHIAPSPTRPTGEELLRLADSVRVGSKEAWLTPEFIRAAREDGRA